jgi:hypothetical protein
MLRACSVRIVLLEQSSVTISLDCQAPPPAAADYGDWLRTGVQANSSGEPVTIGRLPPARYKVTVRGQRPVASGSEQTQEVVLSEQFVEARAGETVTVEVRGR